MAKDAPAKDDLVAEALEAFDLCVEVEGDNRAEARDDIRFAMLEEQWPAKVRKQRDDDGRPCLTINKLGVHVRNVVNDARQNKPGINVHPVDSDADPEVAEIYNGLIRNIEVTSNADVAYDTGLESAVVGGFGYFKINTAYASDDSFDQDIIIERVADPFSIYGDPYSTAADSSDWNTAFDVHSLTRDQFARRYKGAEEVDWETLGYGNLKAPWCDDDRIQIAAYWTREETMKRILALSTGEVVDEATFKIHRDMYDAAGVTVIGDGRMVPTHKVTQRILSGAEVLETINWAGKYIPIIPVYGTEVHLDGRRHFRSLVRSAKDAQRMFNYWRTTATEQVALAPKAPFIGPAGAFETDADKWATANSANHSYIEYDVVSGAPGSGMPQRQAFAGIPAGALQEALNAADDIKAIVGQFDASLGARSNETSGVAINARKVEGDVATFHYIDNLSRSIRHAGRVIIDLIPHVYNQDRILRVMGQDGQPVSVPVNQQTQAIDRKGQPQVDENGQAIMRVYDLTAGKYDLTVKAGPSYSTQREQTVEMLTELVRAFPPAAPIVGPLLIKNMDLPDSEEIVQKLEAMSQPQGADPAQMQAQVQQHAEQMQQAGQMVQQLQTQLVETQQALQQAEQASALESRKLDIQAYDAQTKRMVAINKANEPSALPHSMSGAE